MNHEERYEILRRHVVQLREHFGAVEIVAEREEDDEQGTCRYEHGSGSWFARLGLIRSWLIREEESERVRARMRAEEEGEDGC